MNANVVISRVGRSEFLVGCTRDAYLLSEESSQAWYGELAAMITLSEGINIVLDVSRIEYVHLWLVNRLRRLSEVLATRYHGSLRIWHAKPHVRAVLGACACVENDVPREQLFSADADEDVLGIQPQRRRAA